MPLINYCQLMVEANHSFGERVRCMVCGVGLYPWSRPGSEVRQSDAFNHILSHMPMPIYYCHICPFSAQRQPSVMEHLRIMHKTEFKDALDTGQTLFTDSSELFREEIIGMIQKCYHKKTSR